MNGFGRPEDARAVASVRRLVSAQTYGTTERSGQDALGRINAFGSACSCTVPLPASGAVGKRLSHGRQTDRLEVHDRAVGHLCDAEGDGPLAARQGDLSN